MKKLVDRGKVLRFVEAVKKMPPRVSTPPSISQKEAVALAKPAIRDALDKKGRTLDEIKDVARQCGLDASEVSWSTWQTYLYTQSPGGPSPPARRGASGAGGRQPAGRGAASKRSGARKVATKKTAGRKKTTR